jgi:uncharacterized protein YggL (DUF469 family)
MSASCPRLAFAVQAMLNPACDPAEVFIDFAGFLSLEGMRAEGSRGIQWLLLITREGSQATEADRVLVEEWLTVHGDRVTSHDVGRLVDLAED